MRQSGYAPLVLTIAVIMLFASAFVILSPSLKKQNLVRSVQPTPPGKKLYELETERYIVSVKTNPE